MKTRKFAIFGYGGFGREVEDAYIRQYNVRPTIFVDDVFFVERDSYHKKFSSFDPDKYEVVISIADPKGREDVVSRLPNNTIWGSFIDSRTVIGTNIRIGEGSIVCAGTILTTNINIGKHSQLNILTTIGHDSNVGDYFTSAPGAKISGNCVIKERVYFGTNSASKEKISICSDVTIGMLAAVTKDITLPGTYVGVPARKIK